MSNEEKKFNANKKEEESKRDSEPKFTIESDEHDDFPEMGMVTLLKGRELASIAYDIFSAAYQNVYGANLSVWPGSNVPIIDIFFAHADENPNDEKASALSKTGESTNVHNSLLRETRNYSNRVQYGDRYFLTKDGQEGIEPFLMYNRSIFNNDKPNWGKIVSEVAEPRNFGVPQQLTQVAYIDPATILKFKYGDKNSKGETINYIVNPLKTIAPIPGAAADIELIVFAVNETETVKLANDFGIVSSGLNIVR